MGKRGWEQRILVLLVLLSVPLLVLADGITIDGAFTDWAGKACLADPGGADDQTNPSQADITQFCVDATSQGVYLLMAWDDTGGNQSTTAGITVQTASNTFCRVYATANNPLGTVPSSTLKIYQCADATCSSQNLVCDNGGTPTCTGTQVGSSATWVDPFPRGSGDCQGDYCTTKDTAGEIFVPWIWFGGEPSGSGATFFDFGSYPSGPGQAPKDATGTLACYKSGDTYSCGLPTLVTLSDFTATWVGRGVLLRWETASELDTVGFNLYRATSLHEEPTRVNARLIPPKGLGLEGASYAYFDDAPPVQDVAYYWLEDIDAVLGRRAMDRWWLRGLRQGGSPRSLWRACDGASKSPCASKRLASCPSLSV